MIEQTAKVLRVDNENVLIEVLRQSACGSCSAKAGCGKSLLDNVFKSQPLQVSILNTVGARENDNVLVGLNESGFVQASFYLYIIPLLSMLFFSIVVSTFIVNNGSELFVILAGIAGLFSGSIISKFILKLKQENQTKLFEPTLIKVIPDNISVIPVQSL